MRARGGGRARVSLTLLAVLIGSPPSAPAFAGEGLRLPVGVTTEGRFPTVGSGRCSATACHGSAGPVAGSRILRDEHTTWASRDPHANAYQALLSSWSRSIAAKLGRGEAGAVPAHRDARCLACHATPGPAADPSLAAVVRQDGVGCESCHGPAGAWLALHNTYEWDGLSPRDKEERFGMVPTAVPTRRAETCVRCHVGGAGRDVDHDLIAAGHPRLTFEFAAHLANMPAHWIETGRNATGDFPARAWAIGQAVTARAALELLRERAQAAAGPAHWPEFAEYDCAACHHDLRARPAPDRGAGTGRPAWGTWPFPMLAALADGQSDPAAKALDASLGRLRSSMGEVALAPGEVASQAADAASAVSRWLASVERESFDSRRVEGLIRSIRSPGPGHAGGGGRGWDRETQEYLALVPLRQALPGPERDRGGLLDELRSRQSRLRLPFVPHGPGAFHSSP